MTYLRIVCAQRRCVRLALVEEESLGEVGARGSRVRFRCLHAGHGKFKEGCARARWGRCTTTNAQDCEARQQRSNHSTERSMGVRDNWIVPRVRGRGGEVQKWIGERVVSGADGVIGAEEIKRSRSVPSACGLPLMGAVQKSSKSQIPNGQNP